MKITLTNKLEKIQFDNIPTFIKVMNFYIHYIKMISHYIYL